MTKNKAVIFDMDGVIIDSEKLWKQAENEVFSSLGVIVTDELSDLTKFMTTSEVTKFWHDRFPWQNIESKVVEKMVVLRVIELIGKKECHINGVKPFIEKLRTYNYKIGLATNSPSEIIPVVLNKLDISHLFDAVCSADFVKKTKPEPAIYCETAKKLNVEPQNCIVFEDSNSGMLAAKTAGMTVIAFTNGKKDFDFDFADYKIDEFDRQVIDILINRTPNH